MNRIPFERRALIAHCLVEGVGMRSAARIAKTDLKTVTTTLRDLGDACADYHHRIMRELNCRRLEVDEMWAYIGMKEDNVAPSERGKNGKGDVYTWIAIDPETKLIPSYHVGKRTAADANIFVNDIACRMKGRIQITSDGFKAYQPAIEDAFGTEIDYAQLHKIFKDSLGGISAADWLNKKRYAQPDLDATSKVPLIGNPDLDQVSTSIIERYNLNVRKSLKRCQRATVGFSRQFDCFKAAMDLGKMYYNFCCIHRTIRCTPAMEAKITDHVWEIEEIAALVKPRAANRPPTYNKAA